MRKTEAERAARFAEIVQTRADRLGLSTEAVLAAARAEPRSEVAMRELAAARGVSPAALFEHAIQTALHSDYPTALCLQPSDLDAYLDRSGLAQEILEHVPTCAGCLALIEMVRDVPPSMPVQIVEQHRNSHEWLSRLVRREAEVSASIPQPAHH